MTDGQRRELRDDILRNLGHDLERPPVYLSEEEAARVLKQEKTTLRTWRCTGRYEIPYTKLGRNALYRVLDLVDFLDSRTEGKCNG